jgi:hypothetical protein
MSATPDKVRRTSEGEFMRQKVFIALLLLTVAATAQAQNSSARAGAESATSVTQDGRRLDIASGTRLNAQLQDTLDVSKARVGDKVVLKTTEAIKSNGETLVKKGAHLLGRVSDVSRRAKGSAESSVTLLFDRLESGSLSAPLSVTINSITQAGARGRVGDEEFGAAASSNTSTRAQSGGGNSSGGGLLGGATGAVGNTVGGVTRAAGDVVNGTTETVGNTTRGVGDTLGRVRVSQSASASAEGGSTLSLTGGNLRLEKGTTFNLTLNESAGIEHN